MEESQMKLAEVSCIWLILHPEFYLSCQPARFLSGIVRCIIVLTKMLLMSAMHAINMYYNTYEMLSNCSLTESLRCTFSNYTILYCTHCK